MAEWPDAGVRPAVADRELDEGASTAPGTRRIAAYVAGTLACVLVIAVGAVLGLWFLPFLAGLAVGLAARHVRLQVLLAQSAIVAVIGWAAPLAWQEGSGQPVGATATVVGALAGVPASAALILGITLLVAVIQAITGTWLARAITGRN